MWILLLDIVAPLSSVQDHVCRVLHKHTGHYYYYCCFSGAGRPRKRRSDKKNRDIMAILHIQLFKLMPDSYFTRGIHKAHAHKERWRQRNEYPCPFYPFIHYVCVCVVMVSDWAMVVQVI